MTKIKTKAGEIVLVEVELSYVNPEYELSKDDNGFTWLTYDVEELNAPEGTDYREVKIGKGKYKLLGKLSDITEQQAAEIVDDSIAWAEEMTEYINAMHKQGTYSLSMMSHYSEQYEVAKKSKGYRDYKWKFNCYGEYKDLSALESLHTLIESKGMDVKRTVVILKKS